MALDECLTNDELEQACDVAAEKPSSSVLDEYQARELILNLLTTRGHRGASEDELQLLLEQANDARLRWLLFQCAITGQTRIDIVDGEICSGLREGLCDYQHARGYDVEQQLSRQQQNLTCDDGL